jgi:hypothetical protein
MHNSSCLFVSILSIRFPGQSQTHLGCEWQFRSRCSPEWHCFNTLAYFRPSKREDAVPSGLAVKGVGLRLIACRHCGFESHRKHGCLSLVKVVCFQIEVFKTGWSLVQGSPTRCDVSVCVLEASTMRRPRPDLGCSASEKNNKVLLLQELMIVE